MARWQSGYAAVCKTKVISQKTLSYKILDKFHHLCATYRATAGLSFNSNLICKEIFVRCFNFVGPSISTRSVLAVWIIPHLCLSIMRAGLQHACFNLYVIAMIWPLEDGTSDHRALL